MDNHKLRLVNKYITKVYPHYLNCKFMFELVGVSLYTNDGYFLGDVNVGLFGETRFNLRDNIIKDIENMFGDSNLFENWFKSFHCDKIKLKHS